MASTFLMKAHKYETKHAGSRNWWSIKYDGMRALWDGGLTTNRTDVPWCEGERATGLWSINGKIIRAPEWFLSRLPQNVILDGELWAGVQEFQTVMSICRSHSGEGWEKIRFMVHDAPPPGCVFIFREITEPNCQVRLTIKTTRYFQNLCQKAGMVWYDTRGWQPDFWLNWESAVCTPIEHNLVPKGTPEEQRQFLDRVLDDLVKEGHEGIIIRKQGSLWVAARSHNLLKYKPFTDDEAIVTGVKFGDGKYLGMAGSLICDWKGQEIAISGLTDRERQVLGAFKKKALDSPGQIHRGHGTVFIPATTVITFRYREKTKDGLPKEPRFLRIRGME